MAQESSCIDGLKKMTGQLAQLQLLPDSQQHMDFLSKLQSAMTDYIKKSGHPQQGQQQQQGQPQPNPQGPMQGMMGGGSQGLAPGASVNPDELRRMMMANANAGGSGTA